MKKNASQSNVFDMIVSGLDDSIAYSKGEKLSLVTTHAPAPPPELDAEGVTRIRKQLKMSQGLFAATLNVSTKTVQGWEQGLRTPSNASLRLLQIAQRQPKAVLAALISESRVPMKKSGTRSRARRTGAPRSR